MKKIIRNSGILLLSCLLLMIYGTAKAQNQQQPPPPPKLPDSSQIVYMVNELSKELSLTELQKKEITQLHFEHFKVAKAMMEKNKADHEKTMESMDAFRKDFVAQLEELLTDEQKAELGTFMKNRQPPRGEKQRPPKNKNQ